MTNDATTKSTMVEQLEQIGTDLGFAVRTEAEASDSAFVDLVWFDRRLPVPVQGHTCNIRYAPVLPVVGFEIELHTCLDAKHVKGSVSNLNNLGAQLGVIVIGDDNLAILAKKPTYKQKAPKRMKKILRDRVCRWVYAEAQPKGRIIVMFEDEVADWFGSTAKATAAAAGHTTA